MALYFNTQRVQIYIGAMLMLLAILNCVFAVYVVGRIRQKAPVIIECDSGYISGVEGYVKALEDVKNRLK